jgi:di/tricarboxylate transporter
VTTPQLFLIAVVVIPLALVFLERLRIDLAALLMAVSLAAGQYLGLGVLGAAHSPTDAIKAISGLGQPVLLTLLSLFVITAALERAGVTHWIAGRLLKIGSRSERRLIPLLAATAALLSLVMNNLAAGALVLPCAMEISRRTGIKPSKLLIPVAYGSLLGGAATYFTTANMIVSNLLTTANPPQQPLGILAFTPAGGLIAVAGIAFFALLGRRWLPDRDPAPEQMMARLTGSELEACYQLGERLWEARVVPDSPLAGKTLSESGIGERLGLAVAGVLRGRRVISSMAAEQEIRPNDILLIVGRQERVGSLAEVGLEIDWDNGGRCLSEHGISFVEVMPSPHSSALGRNLRELGFRARYGLTALAIFRGGRSSRTDVGERPLMLGDSLLMTGPRGRLKRLRANPDFILMEPDTGDQRVRPVQAGLTAGFLAVAVAGSILGLPVYLAMMGAALLLLLTGVLDIEEAYRSVRWPAIALIAGMYSVSVAMVNTGLAQLVGEVLLSLIAPLGPLGLAAGAYVVTSLLTQLMGGQITALVTGPVMISAAISMQVDPQAVAVATAIGCSASFLTPIAHPVNVLMIAPGNYRFRDFARIGWRLTLVCFAALVAGLALFWGL